MADEELLAELGPLAAVIADKISTVPVRHCPGGTDDLISELTIAVALYVGRHVLPAEALELRHPPHPAAATWVIETQRRSGKWEDWGPGFGGREEAQQLYEQMVDGSPRPVRLTRRVVTFAVEAEHQPEDPS